MKESQARIQALQARLQAIQADPERPQQVVGSPSPMIELTPEVKPTTVAATSVRSPSAVVAVAEPSGQRSPQRQSSTSGSMVEMAPGRGTSTGFAARELDSTALGSHPQQLDLTATVKALNQQSHQYLRQFQQPQFQQPQAQQAQTQRTQLRREALEQRMHEITQRLEAQVERINQLSGDQEIAMLELKAIADKAERDLKAMELDGELPSDFNPSTLMLEYVDATVPQVERSEEGTWMLTTRPVDLYRAEREAALMAERLRNRTSLSSYNGNHRRNLATQRHRHGKSEDSFLGHLIRRGFLALGEILQPRQMHPQSLRQAHPQRTQPSVPDTFSVKEGTIWLVGALITRVGLNIMLAAFPGAWLLAIGIIVVPAAIAVYQATTFPSSGFVWGCRLFLIMIGLLLGGRLL